MMLYLITGELILLLALCVGDHEAAFDDFKSKNFLGAMLSCIGAAALFIATWPLWLAIIFIGKLRASS